MKRKTFFIILSCLLLAGVQFSPAQAAPPAKPIVLKAAMYLAASMPFSQAAIWIVQEVEKRSAGRLKVEYYWSGSLVPAKETITGLQNGVADLAFLVQSYEPGKLPLCNVTSLPAISEDWYTASMAFAELVKMPAIEAELAQYNIMYLSPLTNSSYQLWSKKQIRTVADLRGKKLLATGEHIVLVKALGAVPVSMVATESYSALEKGTLDGALAPLSHSKGYKYDDVCKFYNPMPFGNKAFLVAMNRNSWKKIPPDLQKMFTDLREEACRRGHETYQIDGEKWIDKLVAEGKMKRTDPSAADVALIRKKAKEEMWDKWVQKMKEKGLPGQEVLDRYVALLKKYDAQSPFKKK
jgi:TRAP-type C4-dicarboxylate transport system substrate-binding protein